MKIEKIIGREVLDSRGNPTVEVDVMAALQFPLEHPLVSTRLLSFATVTSHAIWARAYRRL